jgi:hypothetical protein
MTVMMMMMMMMMVVVMLMLLLLMMMMMMMVVITSGRGDGQRGVSAVFDPGCGRGARRLPLFDRHALPPHRRGATAAQARCQVRHKGRVVSEMFGSVKLQTH